MSETKRYRLRSIQHTNGVEKEHGIVLETTAKMKDWIIVTVDDSKHSPRIREHFLRYLREKWGPKVLVFTNDVEFFVFEELADDDARTLKRLEVAAGEDLDDIGKENFLLREDEPDAAFRDRIKEKLRLVGVSPAETWNSPE